MSEKILLLVKHLDELEPARALLAALPERAFALSFSLEDLRTRFGPSAHEASIDPLHYLLNAHEISCVACFSGAREPGPNSSYLQLSYFDEIGIPTIELQRDLLRDPERARQESAAHHYLPWSGPSGTGYLKLARPATEASAPRDDVVLVTSHLAHSPYTEEERYQFAFAVMRLSREHPQLAFLWRASPAEEQSAEAKLVLSMLGTSGPSNLWLEENEPVEQLLLRASTVVTMAQTALLDYAAAKKPVLAYVSRDVEDQIPELSFARFTRPDELLTAWAALRAEPAGFSVKSSVPHFSADNVRAAFARIEPTRALKPERRELTLRYLAYLQDARSRADLARLNPQIGALEKRVLELEKLLTEQRDKAAKEALKQAINGKGKPHLSVARKALKLVAEVKKRAFRP